LGPLYEIQSFLPHFLPKQSGNHQPVNKFNCGLFLQEHLLYSCVSFLMSLNFVQTDQALISTKTLYALMMCYLMAIFLAATGRASCPHCQAIVHVTVELIDGQMRSGYFEYHQEVLPTFTAIDGREIIPLTNIPTDFYSSDHIRLLDTVTVISGLGKFADPLSIDSLSVNKIDRVVLHSWLTKPAADRVHFLTGEQIELLDSPDLIQFDTTIGFSVVHFVSLNDSVKIEDLQRLARNRGLLGPQQDQLLEHLIIQLRNLRPTDDSELSDILIRMLEDKQARFMVMKSELDSLSDHSIVGQHFAVVQNHLKAWIDFIENLIAYLRDGDKDLLDSAILDIFAERGFPYDSDNHPYENGGVIDREGMTYLIQSYIESSQIVRYLENDYGRLLNAHSIFIFEQAFD